MTQPAPGVADAAAHPAQVAGTGVPTLLDLAASPAIERLAQRTLLDVCMVKQDEMGVPGKVSCARAKGVLPE
jgi:hypothetical protein